MGAPGRCASVSQPEPLNFMMRHIRYNSQQKMKLLALFAFSITLFAQNTLPTVPVNFQVHYLGADTIQSKYGRKLPKTIYAGSVTGTNAGDTTLTIGQGLVLQALRSNGYPALSQLDARQIIQRAQAKGVAGWWNRLSPGGIKALDDIKDLAVFRIISLSPAASAAIIVADEIAKATQPDITALINAIDQNYAADGIQPIMQIPPGGSIVGTLLFEAEAPRFAIPQNAAAHVFTMQVPVAK